MFYMANPTPTTAAEHAKKLQEILGGDVKIQVVSRSDGQQFLAIDTRDLATADNAIDTQLIQLRAKAGIKKEDMPFASDEFGGAILIRVTENTAAAFDKLKAVQSDFADIIKKAIADGAKVFEANPSLSGVRSGIEGDFNYQGLQQPQLFDIKGADFSVIDENLRKAALKFAGEVREIYKKDGVDINKSKEFAGARMLDGNAGNLTDQEIAAFVLATSMETVPQTRCAKSDEPVLHFDNRVEARDFGKSGGKDPELTLQIARQILGDAYGIKGGVDTTTPLGNQLYLDAAKKVSSNGVTRGGCN